MLGIVANLVTDPIASLTTAQKQQGASVLGLIDRTDLQVGAVTGILAVACVLAFAAGWRQWSERQGAPTSAARLVGLGLVASAGAMIIGYGLKGSLAIYLPGGINANTYPNEGLYTIFMLNDSAPYLAWWGVVVAAAGVVWLAFRERLVVRWVGVISVLAVLAAFDVAGPYRSHRLRRHRGACLAYPRLGRPRAAPGVIRRRTVNWGPRPRPGTLTAEPAVMRDCACDYSAPRPSSLARATASARVAAGSLARMVETWLRTVFSLSPRWWATRAFW